MRLFQLGLVLAWIVVTVVTVTAFRNSGLSASVDVFSADLAAGNWRTQFNSDLLVNMALVGLWAAWRERFSTRGIVAGLCCTFGGSLFSFAYIFVLTLTSGGDARQLLLGRQA
ncbi:hypothetical protein E4634_03605 [Mangrovimicrobium sediminis]|uniref:DUF2834 domain-containing protein n=1 Tax=Mangrovimicrobium sediminis TaxID=2562682 RepID=A0A4Z0M6R9_9GAMM|nr:hypothetical protein [Haliea sp. SAOS-164]TGD75106.1 hypothetical protein E4634_03605 [Haliea sp. SAOS-164]